MATLGSIARVAKDRALEMLVAGPSATDALTERLLLFASGDDIDAVALERSGRGRCAFVGCSNAAIPASAPLPSPDSESAPACAFCSSKCRCDHSELVRRLADAVLLPADDPAIIHAVGVLFPHLFRHVSAAQLKAGAVVRAENGALVTEGFDKSHGSATGEPISDIAERTAKPQERAMEPGSESWPFSVGSGAASWNRPAPRLEALRDLRTWVTDETRQLVRVRCENNDPDVNGMFDRVAPLAEAIRRHGVARRREDLPVWGGNLVGVAPVVGEAAGIRKAAVGDALRCRLSDFQLALRLTVAQLALVTDAVFDVIMPTLHFPEPAGCTTPAAWMTALTLLVILSALAGSEPMRRLIGSERAAEMVQLLEALNLNPNGLPVVLDDL